MVSPSGWRARSAMLLAMVLVMSAPAQAAFPGRDGLLAVQASTGTGSC